METTVTDLAQNPAPIASSDAAFASTFGHDTQWQSLAQWAGRHDIWPDVQRVIECSLSRRHEKVIGSILATTTSPTARSLLPSWAEVNSDAEVLQNISLALIRDRSILDHHSPLGFTAPAKSYFKRAVDVHYLAALLIARPPVLGVDVTERSIRWFEILRLWLFVHSLERQAAGIRRDQHIHAVCSKLRVATDDEKYEWLHLVEKLAFPLESCRDPGQLDRRLVFQAESLRMHTGLESLTPSQDQLLGAIIEIASHRPKPFDTSTEAKDRLPDPLVIEVRAIPSLAVTLPTDDDGLDLAISPQRLPGVTPDMDGIYVAAPEPTLTLQRLHARSIWLLSAEQAHYLQFSWSNPTLEELSAISSLSNSLVASATSAERLLGAFLHLGIVTGRSLSQVLQFPVDANPGMEWTWLPSILALRRKSSRRYSGWRPSLLEARQWIRPEREDDDRTLPTPVLQTLAELSAICTDATRLEHLWRCVSHEEPIAVLKNLLDAIAPRVTPGMVAHCFGVRLFAATRDATLTRLLEAHPQSGLPGACAYATWSSTDLAQALRAALPAGPMASPSLNADDSAAGSLLAVLDSRLPRAFADAASRLSGSLINLTAASPRAPDPTTLVTFHNGYVTYVTMLLLAATGARAVSDPFESISHFDFKRHFVFIDDKNTGDAISGRLAPLPSTLSDFVRGPYVDYLNALADIVEPRSRYLAAAVRSLGVLQASHALPFFFFLEHDRDHLTWTSVTESGLEGTGIFDWPLPYNLFRHRLATALRRRAVDCELIDAILGHGETGTETHGDDSWRTWRADMDIVRPAIEDAYAALCAPWPIVPDNLPPLPPSDLNQIADEPSPQYGRTGRRNRRLKRLIAIKREAKRHLKALLKGRKLRDLTSDDVDEISRAMILNSKGMPHASGWVRHAYFIAILRRYGRIVGRSIRSKHYYLRIERGSTPFTDLAPSAEATFLRLRGQLSKALSRSRPDSYRQAAQLGVLSLCLEHRMTDRVVLTAVLHNTDHRLVRFEGRYYLEYAPDLNVSDPDAPVRRHRISRKTASLLSRASARTNSPTNAPMPIPDLLLGMVRELSFISDAPIADCGALLDCLMPIVDQVNAMTLPGVLAGWLAGRVESWSLPWRDWMRLARGLPYEIPASHNTEAPEEPGEAVVIHHCTADSDLLISRGTAFLRKFRKAIRDYERLHKSDSSNSAPERIDPDRPKTRRDLRRHLVKEIRDNSGLVSPTILLLAKWATTHITRKAQGRYVATSSIFRYLAALSPAFVEVAYDVDIRVLNAEELTTVYENILEAGDLAHPGYRSERLQAFHHWCRRTEEIADPFWSELGIATGGACADPGIILAKEYLSAFANLARGQRAFQAAALLLFCCYRFGLRRNEAIGLARDEWIRIGNHVQIIVQPNRYRTLKTRRSSRRVVPLLFVLAPEEVRLIDTWFTELEAICGSNRAAPIFVTDAGQVFGEETIATLAIDALRAATGNPHVVLHHARHTAGTAVALALAELNLPGVKELPGNSAPAIRRDITTLLLGFPGISRRSPWAVARFLGHASPAMAQRSYLHFLGDWADSLVAAHDKDGDGQPLLDHVMDLDAFAPMPSQSAPLEIAGALEFAPSTAIALKFMRLLATKHELEDVAAALQVPSVVASRWRHYLLALDRRLRLPGVHNQPSAEAPIRFLEHMREDSWRRLLLHAVGRTCSKKNGGATSSIGTGTLLQNHIDQPDLTATSLEMVGASRQTLMWEPKHFALARRVLDFWEHPDKRIWVIGTASALSDDEFTRMANQENFVVRGQNEYPSEKKRRIPIDIVTLGDRGQLTQNQRCALIIEESDVGTIRNSFEWLAALSAYMLANT